VTAGQTSLVLEIDEVVSDVFLAELIGWTTVMFGQLPYSIDVSPLGVWRQITKSHVRYHPAS